MKISFREKNGIQIFDIEGNIAFEETQDLEEYIYSHTLPEYSKVAINLARVPYLNSSALGSFVRLLQTFKNKDIELLMMNINEDIENLFQITGVNRYFNFIREENM